jgi:hypothetical protein
VATQGLVVIAAHLVRAAQAVPVDIPVIVATVVSVVFRELVDIPVPVASVGNLDLAVAISSIR